MEWHYSIMFYTAVEAYAIFKNGVVTEKGAPIQHMIMKKN